LTLLWDAEAGDGNGRNGRAGMETRLWWVHGGN
jgi:hypothetical protein